MRYDIEHPVVNDAEFAVWQRYAVRAWPTFMFIGPDGRLIGKHEGEFPVEALDNVLANMIEEYDRAGELDRRPLDFALEIEKERLARPLSFPGKALATERGLFISDSNHNRIVWAGSERRSPSRHRKRRARAERRRGGRGAVQRPARLRAGLAQAVRRRTPETTPSAQ